MASHKIKVNEVAYKGVCGSLFGLAIIAAIARTLIRLRNRQKYALDDALLLFACICLAASTGLLYTLIPNAYLFEELDLKDRVSLPFPITELAKETVYTVRILHAYTLTSWLVIFAAKFCYLSFFRALIDRVKRMIIYWRVVVSITCVLGGLSLCETFIACPHIDATSMQCLQGPGVQRTLVTGVVAKCLDITTDVMLISIPISLLWNVRIKSRQKLGIGAFLCLSIVMVVIAIIKVSSIRTPADSFDLVWETFWQHIEACTAILMVSLTAFRSLFISNRQKVRRYVVGNGILQRFQNWLSSKKASTDEAQQRSSSTEIIQAPPHVTLGMGFRSIQQKGLLDSTVQPLSQSTSPSSLKDDSIDLHTIDTPHQDLITPEVTDSGSSEHQPTKKFSSSTGLQNAGYNKPRHWWQMGIISNLTLTQPKSSESEV